MKRLRAVGLGYVSTVGKGLFVITGMLESPLPLIVAPMEVMEEWGEWTDDLITARAYLTYRKPRLSLVCGGKATCELAPVKRFSEVRGKWVPFTRGVLMYIAGWPIADEERKVFIRCLVKDYE